MPWNPLRARWSIILNEKLKVAHDIKDEVVELKDTIKEPGYRLEELEKYMRRNNVVVYGVPYQNNEKAFQRALDIITGVNVDITPYDIDAAHRLKTRSSTLSPPFIFVESKLKKKLFDWIIYVLLNTNMLFMQASSPATWARLPVMRMRCRQWVVWMYHIRIFDIINVNSIFVSFFYLAIISSRFRYYVLLWKLTPGRIKFPYKTNL